MTIALLRDGFFVPEYAAQVPWLITKSELAELIPGAALLTTRDGWTGLQFTLLGVRAEFYFYFNLHPEGRLLQVQSLAPAEPDVEDTFRANAAVLRTRLGTPNAVDQPQFNHLMWRDEFVWVDYAVYTPDVPATRLHQMSVYFHAGMARAWVPAEDQTLRSVLGLLNRLPGVAVDTVYRRPTEVTIGLTARSLESVARIAHMTSDANMKFSVGRNEYRHANGKLDRSDPAGILYYIRASAPWEPVPGGQVTELQILALRLTSDLYREGLMGEEEAFNLEHVFNNHKGWEVADGDGD
jgi:hypothetical protein